MTLWTKSQICDPLENRKRGGKTVKMTGKGSLNSNLCHKFSCFSANIDIVLCQISAENSYELQMSNFENRLAMLQIRKGTFISERVFTDMIFFHYCVKMYYFLFIR